MKLTPIESSRRDLSNHDKTIVWKKMIVFSLCEHEKCGTTDPRIIVRTMEAEEDNLPQRIDHNFRASDPFLTRQKPLESWR